MKKETTSPGRQTTARARASDEKGKEEKEERKARQKEVDAVQEKVARIVVHQITTRSIAHGRARKVAEKEEKAKAKEKARRMTAASFVEATTSHEIVLNEINVEQEKAWAKDVVWSSQMHHHRCTTTRPST